MLTQSQIEYLHDNGLMPDWAYYQQNGKTAQENYVSQKRKINEEMLSKLRAKKEEAELEKEIEEQVGKAVEKALDELLSDFEKKMK